MTPRSGTRLDTRLVAFGAFAGYAGAAWPLGFLWVPYRMVPQNIDDLEVPQFLDTSINMNW